MEKDYKNFEKIMPLILQNEGGYVHHPADKGGATNKGVTQGVYTTYLKNNGKPFKDVKNITKEEIFNIYYTNYWLLSKSNMMPYKVSVVHFDTAVNWGVTGAAKLLQLTIGVRTDGVIGPKTLEAILTFPELDLALKYCDTRVQRRYRIVEKNPTQSVFLKGWLARDSRVRNYIN